MADLNVKEMFPFTLNEINYLLSLHMNVDMIDTVS